MTDSGAAIKPRIPAYQKEGNYEPPTAALLNGAVASSPDPAIPIKIRSIEDAPQRVTSSNALIDAVQKVYAAVTAQIAYHERELARLRESLKPFATIAPRPNVAPDDGSSAQAIRAVLDLADSLNLNGEKQP
jgi:hypothetical protein